MQDHLSRTSLDELGNEVHISRLYVFCILFSTEVTLMGWFFIRQNLPLFRSNDVQYHVCFKIRLVEERENSVAIVWLKLSVDILLTIDINEVDTAVSIVVVFCSVPGANIILA